MRSFENPSERLSTDYGSEGLGFESLQARRSKPRAAHSLTCGFLFRVSAGRSYSQPQPSPSPSRLCGSDPVTLIGPFTSAQSRSGGGGGTQGE